MKKRKQGSLFVASSAVLLSLAGLASGAIEYPDTLWIPVIFYDYWVDNNGTNPDFESPISVNSAFTGMVAATLDQQKKPVPTALACPGNPPTACHLSEWFRVSGIGGSDATCLFQCDSITNPRVRRWLWTTSTGEPLQSYKGRVGEFIGPNHDTTYDMRNIIIYDSLPFLHLGRTNPNQLGVYEYSNISFFRLDGRGYGIQPAGSAHNYGFTMELHTTFRYRSGLIFNFRGDDDVWVFANNQLVMDLGGRHPPLDGSFNLDNIAGLELNSSYALDFFYAERHTTGSTIRITTNILSLEAPRPKCLSLFADDTIRSGELVPITGQISDCSGPVIPSLSDSIRWKLDSSTYQPGDSILILQGDSTIFTGTSAYRKAGIIGYINISNSDIADTEWVYVLPGPPASIDLVMTSEQPLTEAQILPSINTATPPLTGYIDSASSKLYLYAVLRDRFGNFIQLADNASWMSLNPDTVTVASAPGKCYEGILTRAPGAIRGSTIIIVSSPGLQPDTLLVVLRQSTMVASGRVAQSPAPTLHPVLSEKGTVKFYLASNGMQAINVFSLAGTLICSRTTKENNLSISLPKGVFIVTMQSPGSGQMLYKRIIVH